ncbi:MAG: hypothetical protein KC777_01240 [Cyanobacteria bacterium HKST-UBA02]|nr:hypothetical protein [Cyanobacteria bacterium HKST-UBA02]
MQEDKEDHVELKSAPAAEKVEESQQQELARAGQSSLGIETPVTEKKAGFLHNLLRAGIWVTTLPISLAFMILLLGLVCSPLFISLSTLQISGMHLNQEIWKPAHTITTVAVLIPFFFSVSQTYLAHFFKGTERFTVAARYFSYLLLLPLTLFTWFVASQTEGPAFAANVTAIGAIIGVVFVLISEFGIRLSRRHLRIFSEQKRPVGKLWLAAMVGTAMLVMPVILFRGLGAHFSVACYLMPLLVGSICTLFSRESRPLEALKIAVSVTSYVSWTIFFFSGIYLLSALLQAAALKQIISAALCGPLGLLAFVLLVSAGAAGTSLVLGKSKATD